MDSSFKFSIIMAIYNVENYLTAAIESVIQQDIGFQENVQLILVDDGSCDCSGEICESFREKYPRNIHVIHKENGGQATARNLGMRHIRGKYVNFMDSDDKLERNTLSVVYRFFEKYHNDIDLVAIPMYFFDAAKGNHWQNYKFSEGTRVINLEEDFTATAMSVASSFYRADKLEGLNFDPFLVTGEDMKFNLELLSLTHRLGVVSECKYWYRRRTGSNVSTVQSSLKKKAWYFEYFSHLVNWAFSYYKTREKQIPKFVQYHIASDLQWRLKKNYEAAAKALLSPAEFEIYTARLWTSFYDIDDDVILSLKKIMIEHKVFLFRRKYSKNLFLECSKDGIVMKINERTIFDLSNSTAFIDFINLRENVFELEGYISSVWLDTAKLEIYLRIQELGKTTELPCSITSRIFDDQLYGMPLLTRLSFCGKIDVASMKRKIGIEIILRIDDQEISIKKLKFGRFCPIGQEFSNSYYADHNFLLTHEKSQLGLEKNKMLHHWYYLSKFYFELISSKRREAKKAFFIRPICVLLQKICQKEIWLLSDRIDSAGDNGEAFFLYLNAEYNALVHSFFVISQKGKDSLRLTANTHIVDYLSPKHKFLHLMAKYIISSQGENTVTNPFGKCFSPYRDILYKKKYIFLQHGVLNTDLSGWLNRYSKNISGFITSSPAEYQSILNGNYNYSENEIWLTGLARYDRLYHDEKMLITVMPTWRKYLRDNPADFEKSAWYHFYYSLLTDERLLSVLKKNDYKLCLKLHPNMNSFINYFKNIDGLFIWDIQEEYRVILAESNLVISDYSSASTDFAYLHKPVIYCQFDKEDFFGGGHMCRLGEFDYERDGFGEVEYTLTGSVNRIIEYIENNCTLKELYRDRINHFFAYHDKNNCERIYKKINEVNSCTVR